MRSSVVSALLFGLLGTVQAVSSTGNRLLVVMDDIADMEKYQKFWNDLQERDFTLSFSTPKSDPQLFLHGELAHDHLLLLPSRLKALGPALTGPMLLDFLRQNGNIMLGLSAETPTPSVLNSLLVELDIQIPQERTPLVVDHFTYDTISAAEQHDVLVLPAPPALRADVKNYFDIPGGVLAIPRAVGQTLGNSNPLLTPILRAPATAYSYNSKDEVEGVEEPFAAGSQLSLVTALQSRNSARLTVLGSIEMLEDKWFDASVKTPNGKESKTANQEFAKRVAGWTFKEIGVLKVGDVKHWLDEGTAATNASSGLAHLDLNPKQYRIKNDVTFTIPISEYTWTHYAPYTHPSNDAIQLEFSMLSPYHRLPLTPSTTHTIPSNSTLYTTSFRLPDQHGIFNFRVTYNRPFLTYIDEKHTVNVRHFAHDEWPRSFVITGAWVWVAGIWVTVAGFLGFCAVWLYAEPSKSVTANVGKGKKVR